MLKFLLPLLFATSAFAADMPVKAPAIPFVYGYSGNGFYKFIGTQLATTDATTSIGSVTTAGGSLTGGFGYQWANTGGTTFGAIEVAGSYHNLGGSNLEGAVSSRWSVDAVAKFGGPIANVLQWLPAGFSMPSLPAVGNAVGATHAYIGGGGTLSDTKATVETATKHNLDVKGFLQAGMIQQYCTSPTSCLAVDTYFRFTPAQGGFNVLDNSANIGKQYLAGVHLVF